MNFLIIFGGLAISAGAFYLQYRLRTKAIQQAQDRKDRGEPAFNSTRPRIILGAVAVVLILLGLLITLGH
jgi:hypothetical protein